MLNFDICFTYVIQDVYNSSEVQRNEHQKFYDFKDWINIDYQTKSIGGNLFYFSRLRNDIFS